MFGRLLKHQLKSTYKQFLILYGAIALLGILIGVSIRFNLEALLTITMILFSGAIIAIVVMAVIFIYQILGVSTYGNEGYLTLSLPVSANKLFLSKILSVFIYVIGFAITAVATIFIVLAFVDAESVIYLLEGLGIASAEIISHPFMLIVYVLYYLLAFLNELVIIIFAFALANTGITRRHRIAIAIGIIIAFSIFNDLIVSFEPFSYYVGYNLNGDVILVKYTAETMYSVYENGNVPVFSLMCIIIDVIELPLLYIGSLKIHENKIELN